MHSTLYNLPVDLNVIRSEECMYNLRQQPILQLVITFTHILYLVSSSSKVFVF